VARGRSVDRGLVWWGWGAQGKSAQAEARKHKDHERLRTLIESNKPHVCVLGAASMDCNFIREQVRPAHAHHGRSGTLGCW
jgi:hypothetical protein